MGEGRPYSLHPSVMFNRRPVSSNLLAEDAHFANVSRAGWAHGHQDIFLRVMAGLVPATHDLRCCNHESRGWPVQARP
jgi:hypothetical protein